MDATLDPGAHRRSGCHRLWHRWRPRREQARGTRSDCRARGRRPVGDRRESPSEIRSRFATTSGARRRRVPTCTTSMRSRLPTRRGTTGDSGCARGRYGHHHGQGRGVVSGDPRDPSPLQRCPSPPRSSPGIFVRTVTRLARVLRRTLPRWGPGGSIARRLVG